MAKGEAESPKRLTKKVIKRGPRPKASVPPILKTDMANPKWEPEKVETMPAVEGWYIEEPIEPSATQASSIVKLGTAPTRETKTMAKRGPPIIKKRVR